MLTPFAIKVINQKMLRSIVEEDKNNAQSETDYVLQNKILMRQIQESLETYRFGKGYVVSTDQIKEILNT